MLHPDVTTSDLFPDRPSYRNWLGSRLFLAGREMPIKTVTGQTKLCCTPGVTTAVFYRQGSRFSGKKVTGQTESCCTQMSLRLFLSARQPFFSGGPSDAKKKSDGADEICCTRKVTTQIFLSSSSSSPQRLLSAAKGTLEQGRESTWLAALPREGLREGDSRISFVPAC